MSFLNATLMFGLLAAAIPIALHFLSRREPKRVVFPAVRFLTKRFETNRTRLKIRRWWLLALRIAAIAALALALAHPVVHRSLSVSWLTISLVGLLGIGFLAMASVMLAKRGRTPATYGLTAASIAALSGALLWAGYTVASGPSPQIDNAAPVAIAMVLDNAPTTYWRTADDDRIGRVRELASWMISRLPATSRIAVLDRSGVPAAFSLDTAGALAKIESLDPLQVTRPIGSRIDEAIRLVRTSDLSQRQVLVITDLAKQSWSEQQRITDLSATLGQEPAVSVTVFDLGDFDGTNRSLSLPRLSDPSPPRGSPVPLIATIDLTSSDPIRELSIAAELQLYVSDPRLPVVRNGVVERPPTRQVDRTSVRLAAGGSSEVLLTVPPLEVGTHHAVVRLIGDDALALDDARYFTLDVLPPSPVLLVGDETDDTRIFAAAITAPFETRDPNAEFAVERIAFTDLPAVTLDDFETLLLLDPPRSALGDPMIEKFVRGGGQVLVCLGPSAGEGALELTLIPPLTRRWRPLEPGTFLEVTRGEHPIFAPFRELADDARWSDYRIFQYWQLEVQETDNTLARFAGTGHAAIVERTIGQGRLIVVATPLPALAASTRTWNELFSASEPWPAFVLIRQIVEQMTARGEVSSNAIVGQPFTMRRGTVEADPDRGSASSAAEDSSGIPDASPGDPTEAAERLQLFPPGDQMPVPLTLDREQTRVTITELAEAGTYWLRGRTTTDGFSANLPAELTALERIDAAELDLWFGPDRYTLTTTAEEIELAESQANSGVSLRSPAIFLALVVLLFEQILGNRFYRSATANAGTAKVVPASRGRQAVSA